MLNFSKINVLIIYLLFLVIAAFSILNFQNENNQFIKKKINLGLDLQGGSYLLLEVDTKPMINRKIQSLVLPLKKKLTFGQMKPKEKYKIDHRIKAFKKIKKFF